MNVATDQTGKPGARSPLVEGVLSGRQGAIDSEPTTNAVNTIKAIQGEVQHRSSVRQATLRMLFHCDHKSTKLHNVHQDPKTPGSSSLIMPVENDGPTEDIRAAGSVTWA